VLSQTLPLGIQLKDRPYVNCPLQRHNCCTIVELLRWTPFSSDSASLEGSCYDVPGFSSPPLVAETAPQCDVAAGSTRAAQSACATLFEPPACMSLVLYQLHVDMRTSALHVLLVVAVIVPKDKMVPPCAFDDHWQSQHSDPSTHHAAELSSALAANPNLSALAPNHRRLLATASIASKGKPQCIKGYNQGWIVSMSLTAKQPASHGVGQVGNVCLEQSRPQHTEQNLTSQPARQTCRTQQQGCNLTVHGNMFARHRVPVDIHTFRPAGQLQHWGSQMMRHTPRHVMRPHDVQLRA